MEANSPTQAASFLSAALQTYPLKYSILPGLFSKPLAKNLLFTKLVDRFIEENQMYKDQTMCHFAFIDSLSEIYTDSTEIGTMEDERKKSVTSPDSPFKGKSPVECYRLLRALRLETSSDIDYNSFIVMDERSLADDTVLLVSASEDGQEGEVRSFRVSFEIVHWRLLGYMDGEFFSFDEDLEAATGTEDGVLRV
jgi:hypothetical protein